MKTPYNKLAKIYTNCSGDMTKMADMPIYGETPLKSIPEPWDLVCTCNIGDVGPANLFKWWIDPRLTLTLS